MPSILSRPIKIGRMELKNRMVMAPMGVTVGNLSPASVAYFAARAEGGAAMVFCNIRASLAFESGEHSIYLNDETAPLFRGLAERCTKLAVINAAAASSPRRSSPATGASAGRPCATKCPSARPPARGCTCRVCAATR